MKTYRNGMKATDFSKKQIGIIYGMAKRNELKVERWVMSDLYDLADYYGYDDNKSVERCEVKIQKILEAVFDKDIDKAQALIDEYTTSQFELLGRKAQKSANRDFVM